MKSIEINMSALSQAQKKMCVELIAHSNINFQQKDNQYVAQLKLNPNALNTNTNTNTNTNEKGNININPSSNTKPEGKKQSALNGGKKQLSRAVRIGDLKRLQQLHRSIEIYVYPKRMSLLSLCELVENSYQRFWQQHKKKSAQVRAISFAEWFYRSTIASLRDKLKAEQLLVNLIDSLNHFVPKEPGLRLFYNFLAQNWPTDALFYFLVLRGILEQVAECRILDRSNPGPFGLRLRTNPYERAVSDEEVKAFLATLFNGGISCSRDRPKSLEVIYQGLTQKMFWEQSKRKNFIFFFDLLEHLVLEFSEQETSSSCDMSLSKTEFGDNSVSELEQQQDSAALQKTAPPEIYVMEIDPAEQQRINQRMRQEKTVKIAEQLQSAVMEKLHAMCGSLGVEPSSVTVECVSRLLETVVQLDKSIWLRYRGAVSESELLAVERLQAQFRAQSECGGGRNQLLKGMLLMPAVRRALAGEVRL